MGNKSAIFRYAAKYAAIFILLSLSCAAQVLPLGKVSDPAARLLQQQYISQLQQLSSAASTLRFPFPFYFSQALDVDEAKQKLLPKGSIHFDNFNGQSVIAITGNYYISYSTDMVTPNHGWRRQPIQTSLPW